MNFKSALLNEDMVGRLVILGKKYSETDQCVQQKLTEPALIPNFSDRLSYDTKIHMSYEYPTSV